MDITSLPMEIICNIISILPFNTIIMLLETPTNITPIIHANIDGIIYEYMNGIKDIGDSYILYQFLNSLYKQYFLINKHFNLYTNYVMRFSILKQIQNYINSCSSFEQFISINNIAKNRFETIKLPQIFINKFVRLIAEDNVPICIAGNAVLHMDAFRINLMHTFLIYFKHINTQEKYQQAYDAVFTPTRWIFEDNPTPDELAVKINIFKTFAALKKDTLENTIELVNTINVDMIDDVIALINRQLSPLDALNLCYFGDEVENEPHLEKAIQLTLAGCYVGAARDYASNLNDSQFELFKKLIQLYHNNDDDYNTHELLYLHINGKTQEHIDCFEYLLTHNIATIDNINSVSLLNISQCNRMLELITDGIEFDEIITSV